MTHPNEYDDELGFLDRRLAPRPVTSIMSPEFTWDQPEAQAKPRLRKAKPQHRKPECNHHPLLWVFTWASLSLSVYVAGALIGLPS